MRVSTLIFPDSTIQNVNNKHIIIIVTKHTHIVDVCSCVILLHSLSKVSLSKFWLYRTKITCTCWLLLDEATCSLARQSRSHLFLKITGIVRFPAQNTLQKSLHEMFSWFLGNIDLLISNPNDATLSSLSVWDIQDGCHYGCHFVKLALCTTNHNNFSICDCFRGPWNNF